MNDQKIKQGEILGMENGKITVTDTDMVNAAYKVTSTYKENPSATSSLYITAGNQGGKRREVAGMLRAKSVRPDITVKRRSARILLHNFGRMIRLDSDIRYLKGVGERRAALLSKLGVKTVGGLLRFYPRAYEDWSRIVSIDEAPVGENCCIKAVVGRKPEANLIRKGMTIYKTEVTDGKSIMQITIFNSRYTADKLREGEYLSARSVTICGEGDVLSRRRRAQGGDRIRPIYHCTKG